MSALVKQVRAAVEEMSAALSLWEMRDNTRAQPEVRGAANSAIHSIDAALRHLHELRHTLVGQIRESDDATAGRVDALLARHAAEQAEEAVR
ncbi:hypothetical protein CFN78_02625 [Amycolatopsis antarctica]|uniref:Uncharacterized protein n=1 Tax=Amycolatopsis antarctica TaxID=1854586 RepID=A0A263DAS5_9PSEU|nr:hypothetical protein [Amycolatopsis antarctica]OZM75088.1 hypothetical protein CFN78_02625 [Amycolatopsis antarctica]